jgi:predicted metal-dependent hydrolase
MEPYDRGAQPAELEVRVVRSARRRKTVSARLEGNTLVLQVPGRMSDAEARRWAERMKVRLLSRTERTRLNDDQDLNRRARRLNKLYFDGALEYASIVYVTNQTTKYGSCSPGSRRIRISHQLARMPGFVLDYVIVHELAHLLEANHGSHFWKLVHRYPFAERAIGFLMATGMVPPGERVHDEPSPFIPDDDIVMFPGWDDAFAQLPDDVAG